jgi:hypothetical protein
MAVLMLMNWPGVSKQQNEAVMKELDLDRNLPDGGLFHVAGVATDGIRVTDVWDSADKFQRFADTRIMPAVEKIGITPQPTIEVLPAHNVYLPGAATINKMGATSLPS